MTATATAAKAVSWGTPSPCPKYAEPSRAAAAMLASAVTAQQNLSKPPMESPSPAAPPEACRRRGLRINPAGWIRQQCRMGTTRPAARSVAGRLAQIHVIGRGEAAHGSTGRAPCRRADGRASSEGTDDRATCGTDRGAGQGPAAGTLSAAGKAQTQEARHHDPERQFAHDLSHSTRRFAAENARHFRCIRNVGQAWNESREPRGDGEAV